MRAIAAFIMRGRLQAIIVAAALGLLGGLFPPGWLVSGGVVGLVTLVQGPREGMLNAFATTAIVVLLSGALALHPAMQAVGIFVLLWLPIVWLLALVLYQSRSLALTLMITALLGGALVLVVYGLFEAPAQWWYSHVIEQLLPVMKQAGMEIPDQAAFEANMHEASHIMTGTLAAFISFGLAVSLLIARWWQSEITRPGAFGDEYRNLRLGATAAVIAALLVVPSWIASGGVAEMTSNLLIVAVVLFMFQGLALGHAAVKQFGNNQAWLVAMYVVMVFTMPYGLLFAAVLGVLDNWFDFRARFRNIAR
ncbi:MAG: DUF2232 domain-containing protein [Gammaproteobacteria bacterium]